MKKTLKYLIALLFCISLSAGAMEIISFAGLKISLWNVLQLSFGNIDNKLIGTLNSVMKEYMRPFGIVIIGICVLIFICILLCLFLRWQTAYPIALCGAVLVNAAAGLTVWTIYSKLGEMKRGLEFFGLEKNVKLCIPVILFWVIDYILIILLALWGTVQATKMPEEKRKELFPEDTSGGNNPWESQKESAVMLKREDYLRRIQQLERERDVEKEENRQGKQQGDICFTGAVRGESGIFCDKIYELKERVAVYFAEDERQIYITGFQEEQMLAELYYVGEYDEYCLTPARMGVCYLKSGQPLGLNRHYFLPRGTYIYLKEKNNCFELV